MGPREVFDRQVSLFIADGPEAHPYHGDTPLGGFLMLRAKLAALAPSPGIALAGRVARPALEFTPPR